MDTGQKTESLAQLVADIDKNIVALPEFQRDFVWEIEKTYDLFDSFVRDIFCGALIYGVPSFEITVREIDNRPRVGKGSRKKLKLTSFSREDIEKQVKINGFRLLLDGQQRATSVYRALKGIDDVYFVVSPDSNLSTKAAALPPSKRSLEDVLLEFRGDPPAGHVNIRLSDVYRVLQGECPRERDKAILFLGSCKFAGIDEKNVEECEEFSVYLTHLKNLENLFRQEKLVAYYLLDTDEDKFALFFERSNSKGIQLNFIDILAAKLYGGFNLRDHIEKFEEENPGINLTREVVVRSISFLVSDGRETGRSFILANLNSKHFNNYWSNTCKNYVKCFEYMQAARLVVNPDWMPYDNALIPMIAFLNNVPGKDFAQCNEKQIRILHLWFWMVIFSRKYSSAAQSYVVEDAQMLVKVAKNDFSSLKTFLQKMHFVVSAPEYLLSVNRKYDALYKGVINFIHHTGPGLLNLDNSQPVTKSSQLEDHHIFPKDYLKNKINISGSPVDTQAAVECVINRTLIAKLSNIKISNKSPSKYLAEMADKNKLLDIALESHMIPEGVASGDYDDMYEIFLEDRAKKIYQMMQEKVFSLRDEMLAELNDESEVLRPTKLAVGS